MTRHLISFLSAVCLLLSTAAFANDGFTVGGVGEFGGTATSPYSDNGWTSLDSYRQARDCCGYQNSATDAQLWSDANQADNGSFAQIDNANCAGATYDKLRTTCGLGQTCSTYARGTFLPMRDYNLVNACITPNYDNFTQYQTASGLGFGLNAADVALFAELDNSTWDAFCPNDDCSSATKSQFLAAKDAFQSAQNAIQTALGDASSAKQLTGPLLAGSSIVSNFSTYETACSTTPTEATITANIERVRYFFENSTADNTEENAAKQLCFATIGHTDLSWHPSMLSSFIIAANNSITTQADFKGCSWWKNKAAITGANTQAMKSAGHTIVYDVVAKPDNLLLGAPAISNDKGHAVLNYTLEGQGVLTGGSVDLVTYARNTNGFLVASTPTSDSTFNAVNKIQTTDKLYKVFQRTASSSISKLRNAINSPGGACPAGYSIVNTTDGNTLTTLKNIALKHGTNTGSMPNGHRMEACSGNFLECNAGFNACSNPNGANWNMRLMIYGENNGKTCGITRRRKTGGWHSDTTNWPSGFSMYPVGGTCKDVGTYSGTPRLANGCVGWCWARVLCRKDGATQIIWP